MASTASYMNVFSSTCIRLALKHVRVFGIVCLADGDIKVWDGAVCRVECEGVRASRCVRSQCCRAVTTIAGGTSAEGVPFWTPTTSAMDRLSHHRIRTFPIRF